MPVAVACFYRGKSSIDLLVRAVTRRKGQAFADVPSHCAVVLPSPYQGRGFNTASTLFEYVSTGWHSRMPDTGDIAWSYEVPLVNMDAAIKRAETDRGRYRWWVDGAIGIARWIPNRWYLRWPKLSHLAYRHICSLFLKDVLRDGNWPCPDWLLVQECPASPCDLLFAVRETNGIAANETLPLDTLTHAAG